ncbi:hypothetical protein ACMAVI_000671 [Burkholderia cenocepacia]|nr:MULTISPECIES: hypothetical protein [Burkholderia]MDN7561462.1 hypothetical protein [Burkholderia orbicola]MDN7734935.1 hypothetical protein [Burkholderia orbicola]
MNAIATAIPDVKIFEPKVSGDALLSGTDAVAPAFEDTEYF